jgi:F-type H+-transporting ATPase subunit gamma
MPSLKEIRIRITSVTNTQQLTRAMKMVAAAKLRRAQDNIYAARPYAFEIHKFIAELQGNVDPSTNPLLQKREAVKNVLVVLITADRGLAGAFNTNVIKLAEQTIHNEYGAYQESGNLSMICVGRKGHDYFTRRGYNLVGDYRGYFNNLTLAANDALEDLIRDGYVNGRWDEVKVVYNEFRNTISQNLIAEPFLPIPDTHFVTPVMEKFIEGPVVQHKSNYKTDYLYEPDAETLLQELIPRYLNLQLWRMTLESNAAEQGARMVAMDNATNNAGELLNSLKLYYNRARQAAITKEIIEVSSGAEALSN